jgi:hypothetical protein
MQGIILSIREYIASDTLASGPDTVFCVHNVILGNCNGTDKVTRIVITFLKNEIFIIMT